MATTHFNFTLLSGSDIAGYNSINNLITSIDTNLYSRATVPGMLMLYKGTSAPTGWTALSTLTSPTLAEMSSAIGTPPTGVLWIMKDA